jgi:hypothetical protein
VPFGVSPPSPPSLAFFSKISAAFSVPAPPPPPMQACGDDGDGDGDDDEATTGLLVDDNTGAVDRPVVSRQSEAGAGRRGKRGKQKNLKKGTHSPGLSPGVGNVSPAGHPPSTPQLLSARRLVQEAASEWRSMLGEAGVAVRSRFLY